MTTRNDSTLATSIRVHYPEIPVLTDRISDKGDPAPVRRPGGTPVPPTTPTLWRQSSQPRTIGPHRKEDIPHLGIPMVVESACALGCVEDERAAIRRPNGVTRPSRHQLVQPGAIGIHEIDAPSATNAMTPPVRANRPAGAEPTDATITSTRPTMTKKIRDDRLFNQQRRNLTGPSRRRSTAASSLARADPATPPRSATPSPAGEICRWPYSPRISMPRSASKAATWATSVERRVRLGHVPARDTGAPPARTSDHPSPRRARPARGPRRAGRTRPRTLPARPR